MHIHEEVTYLFNHHVPCFPELEKIQQIHKRMQHLDPVIVGVKGVVAPQYCPIFPVDRIMGLAESNLFRFDFRNEPEQYRNDTIKLRTRTPKRTLHPSARFSISRSPRTDMAKHIQSKISPSIRINSTLI
jgi:hypothetical protein